MSDEADTIAKLTVSIDAGESIDWDAVVAAAPDDHARRMLEHLRLVAGVLDVHRSPADDSPADHSLPLAETPPADSTRWGHLLLVKKIGEGAFGEVYEAVDMWLDHRRALKLLKPAAANVSGRQILHEARKLARVRHPNVVTVHGADRHDGRVGFWMDLIEGQTLEQHVQTGCLSAGEATHIGQELCSALAAVHQADLVHRDIKAQNVMRAFDGGRIILMDFGAGEFRNVPGDGRPQGTPLYLAPELFVGAPASERTDIYALGTLLFYLVTGGFPVEGRSITEIALAHHRKQRRHLRDVRPDLPAAFVRVVERAIDPDPDVRFQTAGDFHEALHPTVPGDVPRQQARPPVDAMQRLGYAMLAAVVLFAIVESLGFIGSRTFEVAFRVDPGFVAGPLEYFRVGREQLLSFAVFWIAGAAVVALGVLGRPFLSRFSRFFGPPGRHARGWSPVMLATSIAVVGAGSAALLTLAYWSALFAPMIAAGGITATNQGDVSGIAPAFREAFKVHGSLSAGLSFLLLLAVVRWFPRLEGRAADPGAVVSLKWFTAALAVIVIALAVAPRRIAVDSFEVAQYEDRPSFVIAERGSDLLVLAVDLVTAPQRIRDGDSRLKRPGQRRRLVDRRFEAGSWRLLTEQELLD